MSPPPPTNGNGVTNGTAVRRITFEPRVTLGNLLTIIGGIGFAALVLVQATQYAAEIKGDVRLLTQRFDSLECALAASGVVSTTTQCMKGLPQRSVSP